MNAINGDVEKLHEAMQGVIPDYKAIINIIACRTNAERQKIKSDYKNQYNRDLVKDLVGDSVKSKFFHFFQTIECIFYTPLDHDCYILYKAMKGMGTDEDALIEVYATRDPVITRQYPDRFKEMFNEEYIPWLESETSGDFQRYMLKLAKGIRKSDKNPVKEECLLLAKELKDTPEWDNPAFIERVFLTPSPEAMTIIVKEYFALTNNVIYNQKKFNNKYVQNLINAITFYANNPYLFFAEKIYYSIKGAGTDDTTLIRVIVSRAEVDLAMINKCYFNKYEKIMVEHIKGDTSGNYRDLLVELVEQQIAT